MRNSACRDSPQELTFSPSKMTSPEVGRSSVPIIWRRVLFPEPEAPTSAMRAPLGMERLTPLRTSVLSFPSL